MKIYLAPLEGITGYTYRRALYNCFGGFDKYFIPFILPNQKGHLSTREKKDIMPENNEGMYAVPQILTKNAEDFIQTAETLQEYGYNEVNLNLGCPSKTVVTKGRGAGFLDRPDELDKFLDEIFRKCDMKISIKTRLGMDDPEEFEDLLTIYNKYPLEELIVHARVQKDYYKNTPRLETFGEAVERAKSPVCYNGDIVTAKDCTRLQDMFPTLDCIMTGRGTLKNTAPIEQRIQRAIEVNSGLDRKKARHFLKKLDKKHAHYYNFYTGRSWENANNYDLCINSASYGIDGTVDFILRMIGRDRDKKKSE